MLVIISDLHLTDGTSGETIRPGAFREFRESLRELAYDASWITLTKYSVVIRALYGSTAVGFFLAFTYAIGRVLEFEPKTMTLL